MDGFLLVNKPIGWTSHDIVAKCRSIFKTRDIGHLGTLDPFASGLLILAFGAATKCLPYLSGYAKTYQADIQLGTQTDSGDLTGQVITTQPIPLLTDALVESVQQQFIGSLQQIPPMYSAKKIDGRKLVDLARRGQTVERQPVNITIHDLRLTLKSIDQIALCATVSTGTFIRTLGEDIAQALGTCGHLVQLTRTAIGPFMLLHAYEITNLAIDTPLISIEKGLSHISLVEIQSIDLVKRISNGMASRLPTEASLVMVVTPTNLLGLFERQADGLYHSVRGLGGISR